MANIVPVAAQKLFGTIRRTEVLKALALLEETYARELARVLEAPLITIQRLVDDLEREGIVATRLIGKERRVTFNPRFFARADLQTLLLRLSQDDERLANAVSALRKRPRKKGKTL
jgi:DNA-binding IclR family transcriptional regulator